MAPYHAQSPADLRALSVLPFRGKRGIGRVMIADSLLAEDRKESWERDINRLIHACGCVEGAVLMAAAFVGCAGYFVWRWASGFGLAWSGLAAAVVLVIAAAAVGKTFGLLRAEVGYRRLVRGIAREWRPAAAEPPSTERPA